MLKDWFELSEAKYIEIDYYDLERSLEKFIGLPDYTLSLTEQQELGNDTWFVINCSEESLEYDFGTEEKLNDTLNELQDDIEYNEGYPPIYSAMEVLAYYGFIPKAKYLVHISW